MQTSTRLLLLLLLDLAEGVTEAAGDQAFGDASDTFGEATSTFGGDE